MRGIDGYDAQIAETFSPKVESFLAAIAGHFAIVALSFDAHEIKRRELKHHHNVPSKRKSR